MTSPRATETFDMAKMGDSLRKAGKKLTELARQHMAGNHDMQLKVAHILDNANTAFLLLEDLKDHHANIEPFEKMDPDNLEMTLIAKRQESREIADTKYEIKNSFPESVRAEVSQILETITTCDLAATAEVSRQIKQMISGPADGLRARGLDDFAADEYKLGLDDSQMAQKLPQVENQKDCLEDTQRLIDKIVNKLPENKGVGSLFKSDWRAKWRALEKELYMNGKLSNQDEMDKASYLPESKEQAFKNLFLKLKQLEKCLSSKPCYVTVAEGHITKVAVAANELKRISLDKGVVKSEVSAVIKAVFDKDFLELEAKISNKAPQQRFDKT